MLSKLIGSKNQFIILKLIKSQENRRLELIFVQMT